LRSSRLATKASVHAGVHSSLRVDGTAAFVDYHYLGWVGFPCELPALRSIQGDDQRYDYAGLA
jgi:hypothetical protein